MNAKCLSIVIALSVVAPLCHAATETESTLDEIIVTAEKRPERLQDVSAQVDVLTTATLDQLQIKQASEIYATIPNLIVARNDTYTNSTIVLRSITQANNSDVPVAIIVDGVPQDDSKQFNSYLFDIAQIEVLKGPQGSLYGRNAEAGAIIINTATPTNELKGLGEISYGNGSTVNGRAALSGAIVPDFLLFRVAGNYVKSDGLIPNTYQHNGSDYIDFDRSLRADLEFLITDKLKLDLIGQFRGFKAGSTYFAPIFSGDPNQFEYPQGNFPNVDTGDQAFLDVKLEAQLGFATLTSVSGYARITEHQISDVDFTNPEVLPAFQVGDNQPSNNHVLSQDVRLVGPAESTFRWLVSADYLQSSQLLSTNIFLDTGHYTSDPFDPLLLLQSSSAENKRQDYGLSTQVDYDVVQDLTLTAGVRFDEDHRKQINLNDNSVREANFNAIEPKFTASYKFTQDALIYASYGVGFRSGGFNQPNFSVPVFGAETLKNDELGLKTQWFDKKLTVDGAAYTGIVSNYQYSYIDFATASPVTGNVDRVRVSGGELETRFTPISTLSFFANVGVSVPKITRSTLFPQYVGNLTPRANEYTLQAGFTYNTPLTDRLSFFVGSNVQHLSKTYWYIDNLDVQDPKTYLNASFGLKSGGLTATIWGKNLLDTRAYETYDPKQATGLPYDVAYPNQPIAFGIDLSMRF